MVSHNEWPDGEGRGFLVTWCLVCSAVQWGIRNSFYHVVFRENNLIRVASVIKWIQQLTSEWTILPWYNPKFLDISFNVSYFVPLFSDVDVINQVDTEHYSCITLHTTPQYSVSQGNVMLDPLWAFHIINILHMLHLKRLTANPCCPKLETSGTQNWILTLNIWNDWIRWDQWVAYEQFKMNELDQ